MLPACHEHRPSQNELNAAAIDENIELSGGIQIRVYNRITIFSDIDNFIFFNRAPSHHGRYIFYRLRSIAYKCQKPFLDKSIEKLPRSLFWGEALKTLKIKSRLLFPNEGRKMQAHP